MLPGFCTHCLHIMVGYGMLNGQTALATGAFPVWVSEVDRFVDDGILFGRYRHAERK